jgi:hypothetical protein
LAQCRDLRVPQRLPHRCLGIGHFLGCALVLPALRDLGRREPAGIGRSAGAGMRPAVCALETAPPQCMTARGFDLRPRSISRRSISRDVCSPGMTVAPAHAGGIRTLFVPDCQENLARSTFNRVRRAFRR